MTAKAWIEQLEAVWRARDPDAFAALFTPDAVYHQGPFGEPHRGFDEIRAHWRATLSRQRDPKIWFGDPIQSGDRASAEWWCVLHAPDTGTPRTASGCIVLRFAPDGRCASFHEYYHAVQDVSVDARPGWFT